MRFRKKSYEEREIKRGRPNSRKRTIEEFLKMGVKSAALIPGKTDYKSVDSMYNAMNNFTAKHPELGVVCRRCGEEVYLINVNFEVNFEEEKE